MKPRARRVTTGMAVLVIVLVVVLAVANLGTVSDHVEAWHFQLTRETALGVASSRSRTAQAAPREPGYNARNRSPMS